PPRAPLPRLRLPVRHCAVPAGPAADRRSIMTHKVKRPVLRLVPLCDPKDFDAVRYSDEPLTLRELLLRAPALSTAPVGGRGLGLPVDRVVIETVVGVPSDCQLYRPPGMTVPAANGRRPATPEPASAAAPAAASAPPPDATTPTPARHPDAIDEGTATCLAYA